MSPHRNACVIMKGQEQTELDLIKIEQPKKLDFLPDEIADADYGLVISGDTLVRSIKLICFSFISSKQDLKLLLGRFD